MSDSILQRLGITWDADRDEPYIVLPPPYQLIRLTPPRLEDTDSMTFAVNVPEINSQMYSLPASFPMERVKDWLERLVAASVQWGAILKQGTPSVLHKIGGLPFDIIRGRVNADGKDEFIGRIAMSIVENPKSKAITNAGDVEPSKFLSDDFNLSNISWRIGYFLLPKFTGKGIMTASLKRQVLLVSQLTSLTDPAIHCPTLFASIWNSNEASGRTLERCGFVRCHSGTMAKKTGEIVSFTRFQWSKPPTAPQN